MQVTAHLSSLRMTPRKVRDVARTLKGADAIAATYRLRYLPHRPARPISKLIDSALANAYHTFGLVKENMMIKDIVVNGGTVLKRFRPKGFGSTSPLIKRTSHVTVVLEEKVPGLKAEKGAKSAPVEAKQAGPTHDHDETKHEVKRELGRKEGFVKNLSRRLFRRKSV